LQDLLAEALAVLHLQLEAARAAQAVDRRRPKDRHVRGEDLVAIDFPQFLGHGRRVLNDLGDRLPLAVDDRHAQDRVGLVAGLLVDLAEARTIEPEIEIGQELGTILTEGAGDDLSDQMEAAAEVSADEESASAAPVAETKPATSREPALSATITRKLGRVVPANLQIDARWDAIRDAREAAKKSDGKNAPSPSVMVAWAVVRAMEKHAAFRSLMLEDDRILENENFDLGVAVAMEGDRLATAVISEANKLAWPDFVRRYNETVEATRGGRVDAMNAPIVISSLGAFGVRAAAPIVVPPSVGTLFVGSAHYELSPNGKKAPSVEVITLSLTFDHRVVNGAGAASFVHQIKELIEGFSIPSAAAVS
jgi:pyruvate/2-oxoglutarate dehydrogenase complex dihydrolipoamide acyltransferase (E2) component